MSTGERISDPMTNGAPDLATQPKRPDMTLGELFGEMTQELGDLFRKEVELAKVEGREEVRRAGIAAGAFTVAGVAAWMAVTFLSFALAWWIDDALNRAVSFLIVAVIWVIASAVLLSVARAKAKQIQVMPETTQTLKEDVQWARMQTN